MVGILIIGLIMISMASVAGYLMLASSYSTTTLLNVSEERTHMLQWENRLISHARKASSSDFVAFPLGEDYEVASVKQYHTFPDWMGGNRNNTWGKPLVYCPYSANGTLGTITTVPLDTSTTYQVTTSGFNVGGTSRNYVTASDAPPHAGVLAFVISLLPNEVAGCDDITVDSSGQYVLSGGQGIVSAITTDTVATSHRLLEPLFVDAYTAADDVADNPINDFEVIQNWQGSKPARLVVYFKDRALDYKLNDLLFLSDQITRAKEIVFKGESRSGVTLSSTSAGVLRSLSFDGVSVHLENLTLDTDVLLDINDSDVVLKNVSLTNVTADNSNIKLTGDISVAGNSHRAIPFALEASVFDSNGYDIAITAVNSNTVLFDAKRSQVFLSSSQLDLTYSAQIPGVYVYEGSYLSVDGTTTTSLAASSSKTGTIYSIGHSAKADFINSIIAAQNNIAASMYVAGEVRLDGASLTYTANGDTGIALDELGVLDFTNSSQMGAAGNSLLKPQTGVNSLGGRFISGSSTIIYAQTECWNGAAQIFTGVPSSTSGTSATNDDNYKIFNQSNWTCNP